MSNSALDELGPVDYVIVEFPAGAANFTGEMADELITLVEAGTIRIIDILVLTKDADGEVEAVLPVTARVLPGDLAMLF